MELTLEDFWTRILPPRSPIHETQPATDLRGWSTNPTIDVAGDFIEAPLVSASNHDLPACSVLLVSAPGAVGKTTLAKKLCAGTGSVYVDLASAGTVGANTLIGGLHRASLLSAWSEGNLALIIDALDEARMRVTEASFLDFLSEVSHLASAESRHPRVVLFGRTGAIEDATLWLGAEGLREEQVGVMEIDFYGVDKSEEFAETVLRSLRDDANRIPPGEVERRAIKLVLQELREQTAAEGQRFAGYAPVLRAVAERVDEEPGNLQLFINDIGNNPQDSPITLTTIAAGILKREQRKVSVLSPDVPVALLSQLYRPDEQLDRLSSELYGTPLPSIPAGLTPQQTTTYEAALDSWMQEHPFLDGKGNASCAVFEAHVCAHALLRHGSATALTKQLELGRKANPFLLELYRDSSSIAANDQAAVPAEHVGVLYSSVRSRLSRGDWANLEVSEAGEGSPLEFEIRIGRGTEERPLYEGLADAGSSLKFGPDLEDVHIDAPSGLDVEVGAGSAYVSVVTPVTIVCRTLMIHGMEMAVAGRLEGEQEGTDLAFLSAQGLIADIQKVPRIHGETVTLEVDWNWEETTYPYPWTGHEPAVTAASSSDPDIEEIHRRLRKFVVVCKAGVGRLGRHASKFENNRMGRGWGRRVLEALVEEGVFRKTDQVYYLDTSRLAEVTGFTYGDCRRGGSTQASVAFARRLLESTPR